MYGIAQEMLIASYCVSLLKIPFFSVRINRGTTLMCRSWWLRGTWGLNAPLIFQGAVNNPIEVGIGYEEVG